MSAVSSIAASSREAQAGGNALPINPEVGEYASLQIVIEIIVKYLLIIPLLGLRLKAGQWPADVDNITRHV